MQTVNFVFTSVSLRFEDTINPFNIFVHTCTELSKYHQALMLNIKID